MKTKVETMGAGAREFDIRVYHGDIAVRATERETWEFEWSSDREDEAILEREGNRIAIRQRGEPVNSPRLNLRLTIPIGTEIVGLHTGNGQITVDGLRARLVCQSGNGDVVLRAAGGDIKLETANGKVQVIDVKGNLQVTSGNGDILLQDAGGKATLDTNNGRVEIMAPRSIALTAHTGHGDIQIGDGPVQSMQIHTHAGKVNCSADLAEGKHRLASGHGDIIMRAARGEVELHTAAGRITVSDARGQLHAHTGHGDVVLQATAGKALVETNAGRIEVKVPRELHLHAVSGNGDITIGDGSVQLAQLETKRGMINCSATFVPGPHVVTNGHGDIRLRSVHGQSRLNTSAGRIEIQDAAGELTAHSGTGDLKVHGATGDIVLETNNGRIDVAAPRAARVRARSGHGDVRIGDGLLLALQATANMGRVTCSADLGPGRHELTSGNGDVALKLRPDARARLDAQTSFGQIHADFPLVRVGRSGSMSFNGMRMVGGVGTAEPDTEIALRTGRGQIEIRRKAEDAPRYEPSVTRTSKAAIPGANKAPTDERRLEVLHALARGEISLDQADALLRGA